MQRDDDSRRARRDHARRVLALAVAVAMAPASAFGAPATHTILMDGTTFVPATLTVSRGDRVEWVNKDPFPHTATATGSFDSKNIAAGKRWHYTATRSGEFPYVCMLHPGMKGVLIVK